MDELVNQLGINFSEDFSIVNYVINIVICAGLLTILSLIYIRFGRAISNRAQLSRVLVIVGVTTFIIISIVKSSLALSLGLVGALSIVRFRTAIKEPEELGYFFIAISIGLGMGANQLLPTLIGFIILVLIITISNRKMFKNSISQNLIIASPCSDDQQTELTKQISNIISQHSNQVDLKRVQFSNDELHFNFLVNLKSLEKVNSIQGELTKIQKGTQVTFLDSEL